MKNLLFCFVFLACSDVQPVPLSKKAESCQEKSEMIKGHINEITELAKTISKCGYEPRDSQGQLKFRAEDIANRGKSGFEAERLNQFSQVIERTQMLLDSLIKENLKLKKMLSEFK